MKKYHWKTLGVLVGIPWLLLAAVGFAAFPDHASGLTLPFFLIGGSPYFLTMGLRHLSGTDPYALHGSVVWTAVVGLSYLVFLALLVGVVRCQRLEARMSCVVAVIAFWCFSLWGFAIWSGQSC